MKTPVRERKDLGLGTAASKKKAYKRGGRERFLPPTAPKSLAPPPMSVFWVVAVPKSRSLGSNIVRKRLEHRDECARGHKTWVEARVRRVQGLVWARKQSCVGLDTRAQRAPTQRPPSLHPIFLWLQGKRTVTWQDTHTHSNAHTSRLGPYYTGRLCAARRLPLHCHSQGPSA